MSSGDHYYTALTVHAFKKFVRVWIGLVNGCYILHAAFSESQFLPFCSGFSLEKVNQSDEDIQFQPKQTIVHSMLVVKQKASSARMIALPHSSESSENSSMRDD